MFFQLKKRYNANLTLHLNPYFNLFSISAQNFLCATYCRDVSNSTQSIIKSHIHELLITNINDSTLIGVEFPKRVSESLQHDTTLNEVVQLHRVGTGTVEHTHAHRTEVRGQPVTERSECSREFLLVDRTRVVCIKPVKATLPILDVFPEGRKLMDVDGT